MHVSFEVQCHHTEAAYVAVPAMSRMLSQECALWTTHSHSVFTS